jgi:hypothetical protein
MKERRTPLQGVRYNYVDEALEAYDVDETPGR